MAAWGGLRLTAVVALAAVAVVSCTSIAGSGGATAQPAEIYAAGPTTSDVRALFSDDNWWPGPPSFEVPPLDSATTPLNERFSISQEFIHLGTAEQFVVRYTVYDSVTSAKGRMTDLLNAFGASPPTPKVGDDVLYFGLSGSGAAPFVSRTFVRVGQIVVTIVWARKDTNTTIEQLGRNAAKVVDGLKKALAGQVRPSPLAVDPALLPPPGLDITLLGSARLPIEAWVGMDLLALPGPVLTVLHNEGITDFAFGDYALDNDTHMEVRSALLTFGTATEATNWATEFAPGTPDQNGIASAYLPVSGTEASGEYHYFFTAGTYGAMLVCRASTGGEAASRECETPMERTAVAWKVGLGG